MGRLLERKLTPRGLATRQRIVEAAAALIYAKGAERMSLDELMAATGASRSQLYHHFEDKEALVREVIDFQASRIVAANAAHLERTDGRNALRAWRDMLLSANKAGIVNGCPLGSLASELCAQSEVARHRLDWSFTAWRQTIETSLRRMQEAGQLKPELDPGATATAILAAVQGGILLSKAARDSRPLEAALDMAFGYLDSYASGTDLKRHEVSGNSPRPAGVADPVFPPSTLGTSPFRITS